MKSNSVTNPQPKVSEKARELAEKLDTVYMEHGPAMRVRQAARDIQSSLSEPLEALRKARKFIRGRHSTISYGPKLLLDEVDAILSKWEPK